MEDELVVDESIVPEDLSLDDILFAPPMVNVIVQGKEKKFWIRPPSDPEKAMAQSASRIQSRKLRTLLEDPKSEHHQLLVEAEIGGMSDEDQRTVWLSSTLFKRLMEADRRSQDNKDDFFVPAPKGKEDGVIPPTNEDMDKYEQKKRSQEALRIKLLEEQRSILYNEVKEQADAMPIEQIRAVLDTLIIDQKTSEEWNNQYGMQILIRCTFLDPDLTERAFKTPEQAMRLLHSKNGQKVLDALLNAHKGLMLDVDQLKN